MLFTVSYITGVQKMRSYVWPEFQRGPDRETIYVKNLKKENLINSEKEEGELFMILKDVGFIFFHACRSVRITSSRRF